MRIINEVKLDYKDVLIQPKRSTLKSRSQVSLKRNYTFRNSANSWTGVPIMAAKWTALVLFKWLVHFQAWALFHLHYKTQ